MKKDIVFYILILLVVVAFLVFAISTLCGDTSLISIDSIAKVLSTVTTLIAAVAFWLQFKRTERLNESNYIMNMNKDFVNNKDMTQVEHVLELYFNQYQALPDEFKNQEHIYSKLALRLDLSRESQDCQKLINYLVYLESLATLVERNVLHIGVIDNLFAYRFFLAINNPIVQETELRPYKDYYKGIYWLCQKWTKSKEHKHLPIPMNEFNLTNENVESEPDGKTILKVDISEASPEDNYREIAALLYDTDPYIYPAAFGNERNIALNAIAKLINTEERENLLSLDNIMLMKHNGHIIGSCVFYEGASAWPTDDFCNLLKGILPENNSFEQVSHEYFEQEVKEAEKYPDDVHIVSLCIAPGYRGRGLGEILLNKVLEHFPKKEYRLEVLLSNCGAIALYNKCGFKSEGDPFDGYSLSKKRKPQCIMMIKEAVYDKGDTDL